MKDVNQKNKILIVQMSFCWWGHCNRIANATLNHLHHTFPRHLWQWEDVKALKKHVGSPCALLKRWVFEIEQRWSLVSLAEHEVEAPLVQLCTYLQKPPTQYLGRLICVSLGAPSALWVLEIGTRTGIS